MSKILVQHCSTALPELLHSMGGMQHQKDLSREVKESPEALGTSESCGSVGRRKRVGERAGLSQYIL